MKQHISVRAIVRHNEKTLLLRRAGGRVSIAGKYELPGGKLGYGEQPEDALARCLRDGAGLSIQTAQLFDVLTYIDRDNRDMQYVFVLYLVSLTADSTKVELGQKYDRYVWRKVSDVQRDTLTESSNLLLGISQHEFTPVSSEDNIVVDSTTDVETHLIVYSDGGSRGNPGPSASGFVIMDRRDHVIDEGGMYLGITTNNQAEYHGVRLGLERALAMGAKTVDFRIDSLLVVNQMNGIYKIKNRELWPINERIRELVSQFNKVTFSHVKREFNQLADGMVNKILDAHADE